MSVNARNFKLVQALGDDHVEAICMLAEDFSRAYHAFVAKQKNQIRGEPR